MKSINSGRKQERGFALLFVFAMAAMVSIMLYMQLPRVGFQAQRDREELLIERGEQYKRGIQLYVTEWRKYPASLDDLEKTNGKRYLRKRYKDPLTGEDEWRVIHINGAGILTDSLVQKQKPEEKPNLNTFITEGPAIGSTGPSGATNSNPGLRRRQSEGGENGVPFPVTDGSGGGVALGQSTNAAAATPQLPNQPPPPPQDAAQNQNQNAGDPQQPLTPQQVYPNGVPQYPGQIVNQQGGQGPGQGQQNTAAGQPPGPNPYGQPFPPGVPGNNPAARMGNGLPVGGLAPNSAIGAINDQLRNPRPAPNMQQITPPGAQIGGGIAGVASKAESESIKIYNERQAYNEWEFVYDATKDKRLLLGGNRNGGIPGTGPGGFPLPNQRNDGRQDGANNQNSFPSTGSNPGTNTGAGGSRPFINGGGFIGSPAGGAPTGGGNPPPPTYPGNQNPNGRR